MANKEREDLKPRDDFGRGQQSRNEPGSGQTGNPDEPNRGSEPGRQGQGGGSERNPSQPDSGKKRPDTESEDEEESR